MTSQPRAPAAGDANHGAPAPSVAARFLLAGAAGLLVLWGLPAIWTQGPVPAGTAGMAAAVAVFAGALALGARGLRDYPHDRLGACNAVTLVRLVLASALIAMLDGQGAAGPWAVLAVAGAALLLDGVDGWLARRAELVSEFGARFDMEVDALLAVVLACHAALSGAAGPAVLILALPRHAFWVAQRVWPWLDGPLPPRFSRKLVCVVQIAVLIAVLVPGMPRALADALVAVAATGLAWSFWRDIRWLARA